MGERSVYKNVGGEEDVRGIAKRVAQITVSAIKQMPVLASKVEDCISLGQGIPSFATPPFIREAVIEALRDLISQFKSLGVTDEELGVMLVENPHRLIGKIG